MIHLPRPVMKRFINAMVKRLPNRLKRLVVLSCISAKVSEAVNLDNATLKKINDLFGLCGSEKAMELPILCREIIWNGQVMCDVSRLISLDGKIEQEVVVQSTVDNILSTMPDWLQYGRLGDTQKDLETLLRNRKTIFGAA